MEKLFCLNRDKAHGEGKAFSAVLWDYCLC